MHRITSIRPIGLDGMRVVVYVDGMLAGKLSVDDVAQLRLEVGRELSDEEFQELEEVANAKRYYSLALGYLGIRARSEAEVREYLKRKGLSEPGSILQRLRDANFINDEEFALQWVENRLALKPRSRRVLELELRKKGLGADDISNALNKYGNEGDLQALESVIVKKRRLSRFRDNRVLEAYLMRQGFSYGQIKEALSRLDELD